jgi:hypothetical protein
MAWSNGFLRLWVVLTVLWAGAVVTMLGKDAFKGLWQANSSISVEYKEGVKDVLDSSHTEQALRRQIVEGIRKGALLLQRTDPDDAKQRLAKADEDADYLLKVMTDENSRRADKLQEALLFLLLPPVILLLFGVTLAWVGRGFRKTPV